MSNEQIVMETVGKDGLTRIVNSFYQHVKTDDLIAPMYPQDDWEGSEQRLRDFLWFRIGQDPKYLLERGHPRLRMRHMPFRIGIPERDRWLVLMGRAMDEQQVPSEARAFLDALFAQIADFMRNLPETSTES